MNFMFDKILFIVTMLLLLFVLVRDFFLGFLDSTSLGRYLLMNEIRDIKKRYTIVDEEKFLIIFKKNRKISMILLLIFSVIVIYFKSNISNILALVVLIILFIFKSREKKYLEPIEESI